MLSPTGVRRICWRSSRSCALTPCSPWSTARECGLVARRSSSSSITPPRNTAPVVDWGLDVELPQRVLDDLWQTATVHTITVRNGVVIDAPGELNLGRTTRLANRAQRRALRGLYATCAIPGCRVRYGRTKLHHVDLVATRRQD